MSTSKVRSVPMLLVLLICLFVVLPIQVSPQEAVVEVSIRTVNLNNEPLYNATVQVYNATESPRTLIDVGETDEDGRIAFTLINNTYYEFEAFWELAYVGTLPRRLITSDVTIDNFNCSLASLKLAVTNEANIPLPLTELNVTYSHFAVVGGYITIGDELHSYYTIGNETTSNQASFVTDQTGTTALSNILVNANYTIEARRYGFLFNKTVISDLSSLLKEGWVNVTFVAPTHALTVNVRDSTNTPIPLAQVEVHEFNRQLPAESGTTDNSGNTRFSLTIGKYQIQTYYQDPELKRTILLNDTVVDVFEDRSFIIQCMIFPISPSVKILDYFGQPIPNVTVEVERRFDAEWVKIEPTRNTGSNGVAPLPNVGGDYRISIYTSGGISQTRTISIDRTEQVVFKLDGWTLMGGYLIATSQLAATILLSLLVISLVLIFLYKRFLQKATEEKPVS